MYIQWKYLRYCYGLKAYLRKYLKEIYFVNSCFIPNCMWEPIIFWNGCTPFAHGCAKILATILLWYWSNVCECVYVCVCMCMCDRVWARKIAGQPSTEQQWLTLTIDHCRACSPPQPILSHSFLHGSARQEVLRICKILPKPEIHTKDLEKQWNSYQIFEETAFDRVWTTT